MYVWMEGGREAFGRFCAGSCRDLIVLTYS